VAFTDVGFRIDPSPLPGALEMKNILNNMKMA
jgi:hypothetical protein